MFHNKPKPEAESGVVAVLVVIILTALLALISLGFSHLINREVRQSLDRQLNLQAYYSAESGLNDAKTYLTNPAANPSQTDCGPPSDITPSPFSGNGGDISGDGIAKYSCIVVNPKPNDLVYNPQAYQTVVFKLKVPSLSRLYFGWENQGTTPASSHPLSATLGLNPTEPNLGNNNPTGELRVGIYPVNSAASQAGADTNAVLNSDAVTYFMYPMTGGSNTVTYQKGVTGRYISGNCGSNPTLPYTGGIPRYCNTIVDGLTSDTDTYYVRLTAIYAPLEVSIQAAKIVGGSPQSLPIPGTEALIDVTGQGNDVLNRISARYPLGNTFSYPAYSAQSVNGICKLFQVPVTSKGEYGSPELYDSSYNTDGNCIVPFNAGAVKGGGPPPPNLVPCGANTDPSFQFPNCKCLPGYTGNPPYTPCNKIIINPPAPSINKWSWNGGNSFTYNVSNATRCEIHVDNPPGGVQPIGLVLNTDFSATAGNPPSGGQLYCWDGGVGPTISGFVGP